MLCKITRILRGLRSANPRTPVQFRAWPPTFPSKNNAKRKNLTRNSRESRKTVGTVSGTAQKQQRPPELPPAASNARPTHGRRNYKITFVGV